MRLSQDSRGFKILGFMRDFFLLSLGVFSAAIGLKTLIIPNGFIDGGVTGVSLLVNSQTGWSFSLVLIIINIPFFILGWRNINLDFALRMAMGIIGLSIAVAFIDIAPFTDDKILASIFGGGLLGCGIGFAMRGGGVLDGTEVMALYVNKHSSFTIGDVILAFNVAIFSVAALLLGVERALYSVLTYLSASKAVDFIIEGIEEYVGVTIVSEQSQKVMDMIPLKVGRGVTSYKGTGGYGKRGEMLGEHEILYTVVTRLEVAKLKKETLLIDNHAFIVQSSVKEIEGGMIKERPLPSKEKSISGRLKKFRTRRD
jgi:uncharacterized membrane-anchored protein YitT (DUF2179 family)